jgi:hypothetical protein
MEDIKESEQKEFKVKRKNTEIGNEEELHKLCNSYVKFIKLNSENQEGNAKTRNAYNKARSK